MECCAEGTEISIKCMRFTIVRGLCKRVPRQARQAALQGKSLLWRTADDAVGCIGGFPPAPPQYQSVAVFQVVSQPHGILRG